MFKNILIPLDLTDRQSLQKVMPIALNFVTQNQAVLNFIHVIPDFGLKMVEDFLPKFWTKTQEDQTYKSFEEMIQPYLTPEIKNTITIERGAVYDKIIHYADKINADLIIVPAIRAQLRNYMLGPNASKIARHAEISVLIAR